MYDFTNFRDSEALERLRKALDYPAHITLSSLGGKGKYSISIQGSLDPKELWKNGIYQNSRYYIFSWGEADGSVELTVRTHKLKKAKFHKKKATTPEQLAAIVNAWTAKADKIEVASKIFADKGASIGGDEYMEKACIGRGTMDTASKKYYYTSSKRNKKWEIENGFSSREDLKSELEFLRGDTMTVGIEVDNDWALNQIEHNPVSFWDGVTRFIESKKPRHGAILKFGPENMDKANLGKAATMENKPTKFKVGQSKVGKQNYFGILSPTIALNRGSVAKLIIIDLNSKKNTKYAPSNIRIGKSYKTAKGGFMFEYSIVKSGDRASRDVAGPGYPNIEKINGKMIGYSAGLRYLIEKRNKGYVALVRAASWHIADAKTRKIAFTYIVGNSLKELSKKLADQDKAVGRIGDEASKMDKAASLDSTIRAFISLIMSSPINQESEQEWTGERKNSAITIINSLANRLIRSRKFPDFKFDIRKEAGNIFVDIFRPANMDLKGMSVALSKSKSK